MPDDVFSIERAAALTEAAYQNIIVSEVNDHVVRLSIMRQPFYWHRHPETDEVFIGVEGILIIELGDKRVRLAPGEAFTVPAGTPHCTRPEGDRSVNLTVERADAKTEPA